MFVPGKVFFGADWTGLAVWVIGWFRVENTIFGGSPLSTAEGD